MHLSATNLLPWIYPKVDCRPAFVDTGTPRQGLAPIWAPIPPPTFNHYPPQLHNGFSSWHDQWTGEELKGRLLRGHLRGQPLRDLLVNTSQSSSVLTPLTKHRRTPAMTNGKHASATHWILGCILHSILYTIHMHTIHHHHSSLQGKVPQEKLQGIHSVPMEKGQKTRNKALSKDAGLMLLGSSTPSSITMSKWHSKITSTPLLLTMSRNGMTSISGTKPPLGRWPLFKKGKVKPTALYVTYLCSSRSQKKTSLGEDPHYQGKFSFSFVLIYFLPFYINLENQINICCLICLSLSLFKNENQIKRLCIISLLLSLL